MSGAARNVLFLSAYHDYRTAKRASIQQVADGARACGHDVSFVSTRFSRLSRIAGDSRLFLWDRANRVETVNGVRCYLWRTAVHPFQSRRRALNAVMAWLYPLYARLPDARFDALIRAADDVVLESSVAVIFMRRIRRLNPRARIIYYATDRLDTVGAHRFIRERLEADADLIAHVCLRSPRMMSDFGWARGKLYRAEFGIDPADFAAAAASPYTSARPVAVSVGSMLFDPSFFAVAARCPAIDFHVIGCGTTFEAPPNVHVHGEMRFADTIPFVRHATIGIAPYRPAPGVEYLAESSLKLAQYGYLGLPAVCPFFAVGEEPGRFGYQPGDVDSIAAAIEAACAAAGRVARRSFTTWREVAERVLAPERFPELALG